MLGLKNEDPEPIKRLKRELQVALHEEDYGAAIRIRDHPFMALYVDKMAFSTLSLSLPPSPIPFVRDVSEEGVLARRG